jgi:hypothetical protein
MNIIEIMQKYDLKYPNSAVDGLVQYLRDFFGGGEIYRHAILRVHWNFPVQLTQIGHSVVNIGIVEHFQWTHLACIHRRRKIVFPHRLLLVGRNIERTKTFKLSRKTAKQKEQIRAIIKTITIYI